jgi:hypothetical protein
MAEGLKFPQTPDEKYKAQVFFTAQSSGGGSGETAILYLPEAVNFSDGIVYDNANLNLAGYAVEQGLGQLKKGKQVQDIINDFTASMTEKVQGDGTLGSDLGQFVSNGGAATLLNLGAQTLFAGDAAEGISSATKITANPHKRSLFRDVAIRSFNFTFLLSPASQSEAVAINNIIKFFRVNAYPVLEAEGLAYRFPTTFDIEFKYKGNDMEDVPKLLPCYLTSVNTTFNPRSSSFFKDGRFNETQLALNFVEERPLSKEDVEGGN